MIKSTVGVNLIVFGVSTHLKKVDKKTLKGSIIKRSHKTYQGKTVYNNC
ncbi:hypothetical protein AGMMS49921_14150 [Endomicrobiia bacterium]|nr:hypothetical protein AGMMS49921_14150 [Endomicrobiia bacterium]